MTHITIAALHDLVLSADQLALVEHEWPDGIVIPTDPDGRDALAARVVALGLDVERAAHQLLSTPAKLAFDKATEPALHAYDEAIEPALLAYDEAIEAASCGCDYDEATEPAQRAFDEAIDAADRTYDEAAAPADRTYYEACARSLLDCLADLTAEVPE